MKYLMSAFLGFALCLSVGCCNCFTDAKCTSDCCCCCENCDCVNGNCTCEDCKNCPTCKK